MAIPATTLRPPQKILVAPSISENRPCYFEKSNNFQETLPEQHGYFQETANSQPVSKPPTTLDEYLSELKVSNLEVLETRVKEFTGLNSKFRIQFSNVDVSLLRIEIGPAEEKYVIWDKRTLRIILLPENDALITRIKEGLRGGIDIKNLLLTLFWSISWVCRGWAR